MSDLIAPYEHKNIALVLAAGNFRTINKNSVCMHVLNPHSDAHEGVCVFILITQMGVGNTQRVIPCVSGATRLCCPAV